MKLCAGAVFPAAGGQLCLRKSVAWLRRWPLGYRAGGALPLLAPVARGPGTRFLVTPY